MELNNETYIATSKEISSFLKKIQQTIGEPGLKKKAIKPKSPIVLYIEANMEGLKKAKELGYTASQLAAFISKEIKGNFKEQRIRSNLWLLLGKGTNSAKNGSVGFYFTYTVDEEDKSGWTPGSQQGVDRYLDIVRKARPKATIMLTSQKPMTKVEWEKIHHKEV